MNYLMTVATACVLAAPTFAPAQEAIEAGDLKLDQWDYSDIYTEGSWSVDQMLDQPTLGLDGEEIGEVEDLVFNRDGRLIALIAEVGGFWDMGDTHVSVPWNEIEGAGDGRVAIPVTEENVDDYDIFDSSGLPGTRNTEDLDENVVQDVAEEDFAGDVWRASDLIGDYARIRGEEEDTWINFGYVTDIVVRDGAIAATIINTRATLGNRTYAYPTDMSWGMGEIPSRRMMAGRTYDIPVLQGDATGLPEFDRDRIGTQ